MARHTGQPCFLCGKIFIESDDVVVCPDCGTPYHRECWKKNNCCVNTGLHASGGTYQPVSTPETAPEEIVCGNCGMHNPPDADRCGNCGKMLSESVLQPESEQPEMTGFEQFQEAAKQAAMGDACCGMDPEDTLGGEKVGDVADFVCRNTLYYLPKFRRFHLSGRKISLNFPCLFFPHLYFANRKMWLFSMLLTFVLALLNLPQAALSFQEVLPDMIAAAQEPADDLFFAMYPNMAEMLQNMLDKLNIWENVFYNAWVICNYTELILSICLGVLGNYIYYRYVLKRVRHIRQNHLPDIMRKAQLQMQGGTNGWLMLGMLVLQYFLSLVMATVLVAFLML